jgi:hypothetical protein
VRDIREDLLERIKATETEMVSDAQLFQHEVKQLEIAFRRRAEEKQGILNGLRRLLDSEQRAFAAGGDDRVQPNALSNLVRPNMPLADFLLQEMAERGPKSKEELRDAAQEAGYFKPGDGGRAVHATVVNLLRVGRAIVLDGGKLRAKPKESLPLLRRA